MHKVTIGRVNGCITDTDATSEFTAEQIEIVKDVVAMVNAATLDKEQWYIIVDNGSTIIVTAHVTRESKD